MIPDALKKIVNLWDGLSKREQTLALATASVVIVMVLFVGYQRSQTVLDGFEDKITQLENKLFNYTRSFEHREITESEYAAIAAQHSSEWTEAEIHDRLRQELYRLAQTTPAPLDKNGIPVPSAANAGNLVDIPSLGKGQMTEGGTGYREYRINLRIPATNLRNIIQFLERLHNSPQSLRIDALDLNRSAENEMVAASIDISRIVADGSPIATSSSVQSSSSGVGRINLNADAWQVDNATVQNIEAQSIHGAVAVQMMAASAEVYMTRSLPGGGNYEMIINISSSSPEVAVGVGVSGDGAVASPMQPVVADGEAHRYQAQFSIPDAGAPVSIQCPLIQSSSGTGAQVEVTGLLLQTASEVYQ